MGLFDALLMSQAEGGFANYPPDHDYWYNARGAPTPAGIEITPEGATKLSAWYRGRDLLATSLAMLPLQVFERLSNERGARVARQHPLYDVLHAKPNGWQDSFGWRRQLMGHLIDYGNAYCRLVPGARGFADQLWPMHPRLVTPEQQEDGRVAYLVRHPRTQQVMRYGDDMVFHLRGPSEDGVVGRSVLACARDNLSIGLAVERYAGLTFGRGVLNGGVIENPGLLNPEASKRMAESFVTATDNYHLPKVLEQGSKWVPPAMSPEDFQMILSRKFTVNDIARWLGVPPHMLSDLERATFSNIEQQGQEFVTYSLGPWLSLWEFAINDQLVLASGRFYAEFQRDALARGTLLDRWQAYQVAVSTGTVTRNEVRRKENLPALDGLDEPIEPAHLTGAPTSGGDPNQPPRPKPAPDEQSRAIAVATAARLLRTEAHDILGLARAHARNSDDFAVAVSTWYAKHLPRVQEALAVSEAFARTYCTEQASRVLDEGRRLDEVLTEWRTPAYAEWLAGAAFLDHEGA